MQLIYEKLTDAEILVTASLVYFYGISAQLKAVVERLHTPMRNKFKIKKMVLLLVAGAALPFVFDSIKVQYQLILDSFNKINGNSPSLYRWEMNHKNKLSGSGGQISPTDMRSKQSGQPDKMVA